MNTERTRSHLIFADQHVHDLSMKYRFNYIDGLEPEFTSSALVFGSAMHAGIQAYLQSTLEGDPLRPDHILDVFRGSGGGSEGQKVRYSAREITGFALSKAGELFALFLDQYDTEAEVIAVEESFTWT